MEEIFQENLELLMQHRRLGDADVAIMAGMSPRAINDLRNGKSKPQRRTLRKLEECFNTRLAERLLMKEELGSRLGHADEKYGAYEFKRLSHLLGDYYLYRRSYDYEDGIVCSHLRISGEDADECFKFVESQANVSRHGEEFRYMFQGIVAVVDQANILQLRSRSKDDKNVIRKTFNFHMSDNDTLLGIMIGLGQDDRGYFPAASPVVAFKSGKQSVSTIAKTIGAYSEQDIEDKRVLGRLNLIAKNYFKTGKLAAVV